MRDVLESTEPGWRPDPSGRYEWRYWDGGWTNRVANSARPGERPDTAPVQEHAPAETSPATPVAGTSATEASDPFALLRDPSALDAPDATAVPTAPASAPAPAPTAPVAAAPAPAPAPPAPVVRTHPTRHDGTTGTPWDAPFVPDVGGSPADGHASGGASKSRRGIVGSVAAFFRSFWEQEESYHSPNAGVQLPPHPKEQQLEPPPSYARAGLVMLSAAGVAIGAYLPWLSGDIAGTPYQLTGYQLHDAWGFTWVAGAFAVAALLGTRRRVMGWVTMALSVVVAALVAKQLLDIHDMVTQLNGQPTANVNIGSGLWIMLASSAIGLIAAFRLDTPAEIV